MLNYIIDSGGYKKMYCHKCGKHNSDTSKFCRYCGTKVTEASDVVIDKDEPATGVASIKIDTSAKLWDKFAEVYDSTGEGCERFNSLSSTYIWELLNRLATNTFESFIAEHKDSLNKLPYKAIEVLKSVYTLSVVGGYKMWIAEALLDEKEELNKFKSFSIDKLVDVWKSYNFDNVYKSLSDDLAYCLARYNNFRLTTLIENAKDFGDLPNEVVEEIKTSLLVQTINGYVAGKIENSFRK